MSVFCRSGRTRPGHAASTWNRRIAGFLRGALLVASILALAACAVGPRVTRPSPPRASAYTAPERQPRLIPGHGEPPQRLVVDGAIPAQWWDLFHSAALESVLRRAIADNPTLVAAHATLAQTRQVLRAARGGYYPQLDFGAALQRQQGPAFALGLLALLPGKHQLPTFDLYSLGPTVSYSPDVFGLTRREVQARRAGVDLERDQLAAAYLTITGKAVEQALTLAELHVQIEAIGRIICDDERDVVLIRREFSVGRASRTDVLAALTQLDADQARLPPLRQARAIAEYALTILVGGTPGRWVAPAFTLADFHLPGRLPLSLPSRLVRQRPDILAAAEQVRLRSAEAGIATAQMYPHLVLSASIATAALRPGMLFGGSSGVWALMAGLTAPIFHGGALRAERRASLDALKASLALYRLTVLSAFAQVADTLRSLDNDAALAAAERRTLEVARTAVRLQRASYAAGRSNVLQLLDAERRYQHARLGFAAARAQRYIDSARLLVALGGGWWKSAHVCARGGAAQSGVGKRRQGEPPL